MPRLVGYRERLNTNFFDCVVFDSIITDPDVVEHARHDRYHDIRLFGTTNIGYAQRTNMVTAGVLPYDQTAVITGWYARACLLDRNAPPTTAETARARNADLEIAYGELKQVAELMRAEMTVGCRPMWQMPLADLLRHHDLDLVEADAEGALERKHAMREAVVASLKKSLKISTEMAETAVDAVVSGLDIKPTRPIVIPTRMGFGVNVAAPKEIHQLLASFRDRGIRASMWVHFAGILTRDIA